MSTRSWIAAALSTLALGAGLWIWKGSNGSASPAQRVETPAPPSASSPAPATRAVPPPRMNELPATPEPTAADSTPAVVKPDQVIVTVNGVAITGRQLVAPGSDGEPSVSREMFDFLRSRAIDRELTFQEAKKQGIELTAAQQAELEQVRKNSKERGVTDEAQLDFEVNDARAGLLQAALLAKALPAPAAAGSGDRQQQADEAQAEYAARLRSYLDDLRSKARISE